MEDNTNNQKLSNHVALPNATAVLVLGILSIVCCMCYGIIGLALGITALILAKKAKEAYLADSERFSAASYSNLKAGRVCAIIGTCLSALYVIFIIIYVLILGVALSGMPWEQL